MIYKHGAWNEVDKIVSAKELKQLALRVFDYIKSVNYYVNSQNLKSELNQQQKKYEQLKKDSAVELSDRQKEVLALLERGYSNARIADLLGISVATVKTHLVSLFRALNANNRTECVRVAREMRLID